MTIRSAGSCALACVGLWVSACGSDAPPPKAATGGSNSPVISPLAGTTSSGGERNAPSGGASAAGEGGQTFERLPVGDIDGGSFAVSKGGAPSDSPPACDPKGAWDIATLLDGVSTEADERLLAMTPDERTVIFERDGALLIAERPSVDADFTTASALALPAGYDVARGLALGARGLELVIVKDDGTAFAALSRSSRGEQFGGEPSTERFAVVNDARTFSGGELSSPVLSEDGKTFFYAQRAGGRAEVWRATGTELDLRTKLDPVTLGGEPGRAKLPSSVSADGRVLFVLDEALGHIVGLWSETPVAAFTRAVPFPDLSSAFTNTDCDRLYGTREDGASLDVVIATP